MKYAVVILDGAAGLPLEELGGLTTLEAARTPNLDKIASSGTIGLAKNVPDGLECSSNVACTSIMGFDPALYPIGRGAIEGLAAGVDLGPGEIAMRVNLCSVSDGLMRSYSADNITTEEAAPYIAALSEALDDDVFSIYPSVGFRAILVVKGHPEIMECSFHEAHNISDQPVEGKGPFGPAAELIASYERRATEILESHPANETRFAAGKLPVNRAWVFWPGLKPDSMQTFSDAYGLSASMQTGVDLLRGLAILTGMKVCEFEGVTDGADTDYSAQGRGALEMLEYFDVAIVHVESPDAEGHDGNAAGKVAAIEAIDSEIVSRLLELAASCDLRILALPDHPTPVSLKRHTPDMVPFCICGPGIPRTGGFRLTEMQGRSTGVVVDPGHSLMSYLVGARSFE